MDVVKLWENNDASDKFGKNTQVHTVYDTVLSFEAPCVYQGLGEYVQSYMYSSRS